MRYLVLWDVEEEEEETVRKERARDGGMGDLGVEGWICCGNIARTFLLKNLVREKSNDM